jgi:hypothetical protein
MNKKDNPMRSQTAWRYHNKKTHPTGGKNSGICPAYAPHWISVIVDTVLGIASSLGGKL